MVIFYIHGMNHSFERMYDRLHQVEGLLGVSY